MADLTPEQIVEGLHAHEEAILLIAFRDAADAELAESDIAERSKLEVAQARSATERLKLKGVVEEVVERRRVTELVQLGEAGKAYLEKGTPEARIVAALKAGDAKTPGEWKERLGLSQEEWGTAFGALKALKLVDAAGGKLVWKGGAGEDRIDALSKAIDAMKTGGEVPLADLLPVCQEEVLKRAKKARGSGDAWFKRREHVERFYRIVSGRENPVLRVLKERGPRNEGREYDFSLPPPRIVFGRAHPYRAFLDWVRKKLVSLGFEEMAGDMVESEFWNSDALYMPQFHPARAIHDVYYVRGEGGGERGEGAIAKTAEPLVPFVDRVAAAHENGGQTGSRGWRYRFDREWTRRMILRSQGTALSARWMAKADLKIPGKYFGIARCFRNDTVDATHAPDFFQVEGIVASRTIDMTHLLGLLKLFAEEVARAKEVKFLPAYFPYTEPSVEVHIKHPTIGWMEMGGSGIFRPEVTRPLLGDPEARVIAWGLGLDRMAMSALGISDIRDLFSPDLEALRGKPAIFL